MTKDYDVIIIGSGPAGMFAADELADSDLSVLVIDRGQDIDERSCPMKRTSVCVHCTPCGIMSGVGGAGTFSDGTLNLRPDIGGDLAMLTGNAEYAWDVVRHVDEVFLRYGAPDLVSEPNEQVMEDLKRRAASVGARFIDIPQRHIGSDNSPTVIKNFNVIMAPGRIGASWVNEMVDRHGIAASYGGLDVGVRVEVPAIIMDPVTRINRDPKFHIHTRRYDDFVRTFCTNANGYVVKEEYSEFIATNGHSMTNEMSENTNFAFLVRISLTHPIENTTRYGTSIAKLATTIGGGKPVLQRMGDLRRGRRSTEERIRRNQVVNTLKDVTPGDISMALPHRIVMDIIEGLEVLNEIIPGVASDSTLLYAPEIKFYAMEIDCDRNMETSVCNLFATGDGAGLSRDIVNAAATGVLAARGILR